MAENIIFRYVYEKMGTVAPPNILPNDIWVDVGNVIKDGVFDHHQHGGMGSAFESVITYTGNYQGVRGYLASYSGEEPPEVVFHMHEFPDLDCVACVFAIQEMLLEGAAAPGEVFEEWVLKKILEFVHEIDAGKKKILSELTFYAYFRKIVVNEQDRQMGDEQLLTEGLKLLEMVVRALTETKKDIDLFTAPLSEYIDVSALTYYEEAKAALEESMSCYRDDKQKNKVILKFVNLWNKDKNRIEPVKAAIWRGLPSGKDEYIFAQALDQCMLTVYPYRVKREGSGDGVTRVIISLDTNQEASGSYTLLPLAEVLEQYEQLDEDLLFKSTGRYRRDHSHAREERGRFAEYPFSETDDPWYISTDETIIDTPRIRSILPYGRIISIVENSSSMAKAASLVRFHVKQDRGEIPSRRHEDRIWAETDAEHADISFGKLYRLTREKLREMQDGQDTEYLFAMVKIDPSMLKYSNAFLKVCCLNMVGKSDTRISLDNILYLDYRTCLYVDPSITVLAAVDAGNPSLQNLVGDDFLQSEMCRNLKNILEHRHELRDIGKSLLDKEHGIQRGTENIEEFNTRLVNLNVRIQKDDLVVNPLEQEVYAFMKEILGIDALRESVTASAELLIKNAEQKRDRDAKKAVEEREKREKAAEEAERRSDNQLQAIMGLFAILGIFSALVDCFDFIGKFGPEGEWSVMFGAVRFAEIVGWVIIGIISALAILFALKAIVAAFRDRK